jgi:hypothetical protein
MRIPEVYQNLQRQGYTLSPDVLSAILAKPSSQQPHALVAFLKEYGYGLGEPSAGEIALEAGCAFAANDFAEVVEAAHRSGAWSNRPALGPPNSRLLAICPSRSLGRRTRRMMHWLNSLGSHSLRHFCTYE